MNKKAECHQYLVTGASSGIGLALTQRLLDSGHAVIALGRDQSKLDKLSHASDRVETVSCDFSDLANAMNRFQDLAKTHSDVESLILCAGYGQFGSLEEFSYEALDKMMAVNFQAHVYLVRSFIAQLKQRQHGRIIFLGSEAALQGARYGAMYCASKFALRGFAQSLRYECSRNGIGVTLVNPGLVRSPFYDALAFEPGPEPNHAIEIADVVDSIMTVLAMRPGTNVDEINLSPQQHVVRKK